MRQGRAGVCRWASFPEELLWYLKAFLPHVDEKGLAADGLVLEHETEIPLRTSLTPRVVVLVSTESTRCHSSVNRGPVLSCAQMRAFPPW